jgi:hypothetical protein
LSSCSLLFRRSCVDSRTLVRIALCIAGTVRVSETTVFELPFAKGLDPYKLDQKLPDESKELLSDLLSEHGGTRVKFEDDHLRFEVPEDRADSLRADLSDWMALDKSAKRFFQPKRLVQYSKIETRAPSGAKRRPGKGRGEEVEPARKGAPKPKERGVRDERPQGAGKGAEPPGKAEPGEGRGFRVEIPVNMRGLVRRLQGNPHVKALMDEYGGKPLKGEGLVMEFPDRKQRSEILDEVADAIRSSGFLREVLDTAEI